MYTINTEVFAQMSNENEHMKMEEPSGQTVDVSHNKSESQVLEHTIPEAGGTSSCIKLRKHSATTSHRVYKTVCIMMTNLAMGLSYGLNGPTLVHIEHLLDTDIQALGVAYMIGTVGYILGCIICRFIMQCCNPELFLGVLSFSGHHLCCWATMGTQCCLFCSYTHH